MSKGNLDDDHKHTRTKHETNQVSLKCGEPGSALLNDTTLAGTTVTTAAITIDTSEFCNPCTKLEFTSNIIGTGFVGSLNFQVFKFCDNGIPTPIGPQFNFVETVPSINANTFRFFICDCDSCLKGCCTYTVVVTAGTVITNNVGVFAARLVAITVDNPEHCC